MAKQVLNVGSAPDDGTGDTVRAGAIKTNDNFTELYDADVVTAAHIASTSNPHSVTKTQVSLGNVDNTSNATERAATATLTNKTLTAPVVNSPTGIVKADVGLGNVDNTSNATERAATATLTNKTLTSPVINSPTGLAKADVGLSNVDNTADSAKPVSSAQQTALNLKEDAADKGAANGYASLGADSKIPTAQLPALAITDTFVVASQSAQTGLTAEVGDICIRTDQNKSYILKTDPASTFANWSELLTPTDTVLSVNSLTGAVTLTTANIADSANKRYVTDANLTVIGNTSGTNTGDNPGVTSVTGSAPIVSSGGNTPAISISAATTSAAGSLSAADKVKINALTGSEVTSVTGTAPVVSSGGATPAISMAAATASVNGYATSTQITKLNGIATAATANGTVTGSGTTSGSNTGDQTNITGNAATVTTNANLTGHITSTGNAAVLGSFTSAQLATALTNETGSGLAVFGTSPSLISPALGTPASGVVTNLTGTASININGTVGAGTPTTVAATTVTASGIVGTAATAAIKLPSGTTGQRPTAATGMLRFNSTDTSFEGYDGSAWGAIGGSAANEGFTVNINAVAADYTLATNSNASSVGPITVNTGVTVTIPTGSRWVII
mgnify:CR=1 FL=1